MGYPSTPWRALALGCLLLVGVAAGCGGTDDATESAPASIQVEASNTAEGRFPDEELVRAQEEAAAAEAAQLAAEPASEPIESTEPIEPTEPTEPTEPIESTPSPVDEASGIPVGALEAGRYTSKTFEPQFSIEVDDRWISFQAELQDFIALSPADDGDLSISFLSPNLATALIDEDAEYTTEDPTEEQLLDHVGFDYFDWIHQHPSYEAGEIRNELLAGRAVSSFDATLTSGYAWRECFVDCALLVATSDGELLAQEVGYRERLYETTVGDLTFVVSVAAPEAKFDAFAARAVELLSTLELTADAEIAIQPEELPAPEDPVATEAPSESPVLADPPPPAPAPPAPVDEPLGTENAPETVEPERLPPAPLES